MTDTDHSAPLAAEIASGAGLYLSAAARLLPRHRRDRPVSPSCLYRWATSGVRLPSGELLRLETLSIAGKLCTSRQALERFLAAQSAEQQPATLPLRTPTRRQRDHEAATAALTERYGI